MVLVQLLLGVCESSASGCVSVIGRCTQRISTHGFSCGNLCCGECDEVARSNSGSLLPFERAREVCFLLLQMSVCAGWWGWCAITINGRDMVQLQRVRVDGSEVSRVFQFLALHPFSASGQCL
jgi:hypothetical protein